MRDEREHAGKGEKGERGVLSAVRDDTRCLRVLTAGPAGRG